MNLTDYIRWRGDASFSEREFNDADNAVLSALAYLDFSEPLSENIGLTVKRAAEYDCPSTAFDDLKPLLTAAAKSERFGETVISEYLEIIDTDEEKTQFCAMTFTLPNGIRYIAFRGTDDTIVGWREDFCISFTVSSAQKRAAEYLQNALKTAGKVYVGGHSKGGNLAIHAAMSLSENQREKVIKIYSNDAPNPCPELIDKESYNALESKIERIVPEFAVIGMLFDENYPKKIIKSDGAGFMQHRMMTWQTAPDGMEEVTDTAEQSKLIDDIFSQWIDNTDMESRKSFTNEFFDALGARGAKRMSEIPLSGGEGILDILLKFSAGEKKSRNTLSRLIRIIISKIKNGDWGKVLGDTEMLKGIGLFFLGVFFVALPNQAVPIIGNMFFMWIAGYCILKLTDNYKKIKSGEVARSIKVKTVLFGIILIVDVICVAVGKVAILSANAILAFFLLWRAYNQLKKCIADKKARQRIWLLRAADVGFGVIFSVCLLSMATSVTWQLIITIGAYIIVQAVAVISNRLLNGR